MQWFGKGRKLAKAQKAELAGNLAEAIALYVEAEAPNEAARVLCLRGDAELDRRVRLVHYTQATKTALEGSEVAREARRKRAELIVSEFEGQVTSAAIRKDILDAARELEGVGAWEAAARAFRLAGDRESQARALTQAGDIDRLEEALDDEAERSARTIEMALRSAEDRVDLGERREALVTLQALHKQHPAHEGLRGRILDLEGRKLDAMRFRLEWQGFRGEVCLRRELTLGRTETCIDVASAAVSRLHLRFFKQGDTIMIEDCQSRNGTFLHGVRLAGAIPLTESGTVLLGNEVPLSYRILTLVSTPALELRVSGHTVVAPFDEVSIADWTLCEGAGGWVELRNGSAMYRENLLMAKTITLLHGDAFTLQRGGGEVFRVLRS